MKSLRAKKTILFASLELQQARVRKGRQVTRMNSAGKTAKKRLLCPHGWLVCHVQLADGLHNFSGASTVQLQLPRADTNWSLVRCGTLWVCSKPNLFWQLPHPLICTSTIWTPPAPLAYIRICAHHRIVNPCLAHNVILLPTNLANLTVSHFAKDFPLLIKCVTSLHATQNCNVRNP